MCTGSPRFGSRSVSASAGYTPSFTRSSARSRPESGSGWPAPSRRSGALNFVTSARTSALTSATAGLARRIASWTERAAALPEVATPHALASRTTPQTDLRAGRFIGWCGSYYHAQADQLGDRRDVERSLHDVCQAIVAGERARRAAPARG